MASQDQYSVYNICHLSIVTCNVITGNVLTTKINNVNEFFEMATVPLPCNGILVVVGSSPRIFPMSSLIYASFLIPYFNL